MQEALIIETITESLDTIADSKSKQITSIEEVLEIAKQKLGRGEGRTQN